MTAWHHPDNSSGASVMGFNSGNGGTMTVGVVTLHNTRFTVNHDIRDVDNTNSGTGGFSNYEMVVKDIQWNAEGPLDEDNLPDVDAGLAVGTKVSITFKEGADSRTLVVTNTLVKNIEYIVDNSGDIVRWRATGKGCTGFTNHTT